MDTEPAKRPVVSFLSVISLGNILAVLSLIGTGLFGIYTIGGEVQRVQDAVTHEADMRGEAERSLNEKLANTAAQEARDVQATALSLGDLKADVRALVQASTPPGRR
jgi:hypothetical protein